MECQVPSRGSTVLPLDKTMDLVGQEMWLRDDGGSQEMKCCREAEEKTTVRNEKTLTGGGRITQDATVRE